MPTKWFTDKKISGRVVKNGWIVADKNLTPWYVREDLPRNQKLSSEVFLFEKKTLIENAVLRPLGFELLSERDQKSLKAIHSLINMCQLAYHRISKNVLKKLLINSVDEIARNNLEAIHDDHSQAESDMSNPTPDEIRNLSSFIAHQPVEEGKSTRIFTLKFF